MAYLDELYRERAERAGIVYVDIWDGFVDDQGRYAVDGPDFEGQIRRLRTADGVHFTKAGAVKLASYVDQELRRVRPSHVAPIALPEADCRRPTNPARRDPTSARSCRSPSLAPRAAPAALSAGGNHPAPLASDPQAQKVFDRGAPVTAVSGRADDFSWPRPAAPIDAAPQPVSLTPAAPAKKSAAQERRQTAGRRQEGCEEEAGKGHRRPERCRCPPGASAARYARWRTAAAEGHRRRVLMEWSPHFRSRLSAFGRAVSAREYRAAGLRPDRRVNE